MIPQIILLMSLLLVPLDARTASSDDFDGWYTITAFPKMHYAYYSEHIELKKGRLYYQSHMWKKEEGFLNEEELGAFAENNEALTPLFYNYHATYRTTETTIDGNVKEGNKLFVKVRRGDGEMPLIRKIVSKRAFFSAFFAVWLKRQLNTAHLNKNMNFLTILEDSIDVGFKTVPGHARLMPLDEYARKTETRRFAVEYHDMKSIWWVDKSGEALRIDMPAQKIVIERVSKAKAEAFLNE